MPPSSNAFPSPDYTESLKKEEVCLPETYIDDLPPADKAIVIDLPLSVLRRICLVLIILVVGAIAVVTATARSAGSPKAIGAAPTKAPLTHVPDQQGNATGYHVDPAALAKQVNPQEGFTLPATYGTLGPQLIRMGAIDPTAFAQVYANARQPLTETQLAILSQGSTLPVVIDPSNAYFLLNFFWAVGLSNQNRILDSGPMMQGGKSQIGRFASTGGWTLGRRPAVDLYSSTPLILLTLEQQTRLEKVAAGVYRPCCGNPTIFPDCNHGMAMLGLLELMASQGATEDQLFTAAKQLNAFWFPQQTLEIAAYYKARQDIDFAQADPRQVVGVDFSSGQGFQNVHKWLAANGLLDQNGGGGNSCGV